MAEERAKRFWAEVPVEEGAGRFPCHPRLLAIPEVEDVSGVRDHEQLDLSIQLFQAGDEETTPGGFRFGW